MSSYEMAFHIIISFLLSPMIAALPTQAASHLSFRPHHSPTFHEALQPWPPHGLNPQKPSLLSDVPKELPKKTPFETYSLTHLGIGFAVYLVLVLVLGFAYQRFYSNKPLQDMRFLPKDGFSDAIHSCGSHWPICCWACCCPCLRWSDTVNKVGLMSFWIGVVLWAILFFANGLVAGLAWPVIALLGAFYRYRLRTHYGFPISCMTIVQDLVAWWCCMPCAIAQEARHVDREQGHKQGSGSLFN